MKNTAINFIVCLPNDKTRVAGLLEDLQKEFNYVIEEGLELVTVRHYQTDVLAEMKQGKLVLLEDNFEKTVQMVLRDVPMIRRKSAS
jgi:aspartate kinase